MPFEIPLSEPSFDGNEWSYLKECLDTGWVSSEGPFVVRFEQVVAEFLGLPHAVATCNGTSALHIALKVAGIQPDDEIVMPALTFIAPANAIRYVGAYPVFVDVDPLFWQMDPQRVTDFLKEGCLWKQKSLYNKQTGRRVKAILPVHILGHPVAMDPILGLAKEYGLVVIEDAAEALGARVKGDLVGTLGDIACLSFNGNKIVTCGGGGAVVTRNPQWAEKALYLTTQAKDDPVEYVHMEIGYNYRLTNLQAAVGVAQMEKLEHTIRRKREIAHRYQQTLREEGLLIFQEAPWAKSIYWLNAVQWNEGRYGMNRHQLRDFLKRRGIATRPLWHPLPKLAPFANCYASRVENTNRLYETVLSLPSSVGLTKEDQDRVIFSLLEAKKEGLLLKERVG